MYVATQEERNRLVRMIFDFNALFVRVFNSATEFEKWMIRELLDRTERLSNAAWRDYSEERRFYFTGELNFAVANLNMLTEYFRRRDQPQRLP